MTSDHSLAKFMNHILREAYYILLFQLFELNYVQNPNETLFLGKVKVTTLEIVSEIIYFDNRDFTIATFTLTVKRLIFLSLLTSLDHFI